MGTQLTVDRKLFLSLGATLFVAIFVSVYALVAIGSLGTRTDALVRGPAREQFLAGDQDTAITAALAFERGILARAFMKDQATMQRYNDGFSASMSRLQSRLDEFASLEETEEGRRGVAALKDEASRLRISHDQYWQQAGSGQLDAAAATYRDVTNPAMQRMVGMAERLVALQGELMEKRRQEAEGAPG